MHIKQKINICIKEKGRTSFIQLTNINKFSIKYMDYKSKQGTKNESIINKRCKNTWKSR